VSFQLQRLLRAPFLLVAAAVLLSLALLSPVGAGDAAPEAAPAPAAASVCPAYPAFPNASCTGWRHTGVKLRKVPGTVSRGNGWYVETNGGSPYLYVTKPGAVLDGLDIGVCVKIFANNVVIKRSRIRCNDYYVVRTADPPVKYSGLRLTDVELDGTGDTSSTSIAVEGAANSVYTRLDVHGVTSSGPRIATGNVIQDSYIHGIPCAPGNHTAGLSANAGGSNIVVRHNNIDISNAGGCASASWAIYKDFGTYAGVLTEKNLFNGGSYCAYAAVRVAQDTRPAVSGIKFIDNVFGRKYSAQCGGYGPIAQYAAGPGNVWRHNTWGGGAKATAAHRTGDPVVP
jgi:hypothetical protein